MEIRVGEQNNFVLRGGVNIPSIGLGTASPLHETYEHIRGLPNTLSGKVERKLFYNRYAMKWWRRSMSQLWKDSFLHALKSGYRLIDTSAAYGCEELLSQAIAESGVRRDELFITTRISNQQQWNSNARDSLMESMGKLGVNYIDLFMIHWPVPDTYIDVWSKMEGLYGEGLVRSIGVANCHQHHLDKLLESANVVPMLNQFEIHPLMTQKPLIKYCQDKGIQVEAYTPIGRFNEKLAQSSVLKSIAEWHSKTIVQVILRWHIQNRVIPVVRSKNFARIDQNMDIFNFELRPDEMRAIDGMNENLRLRYDPDNCDFSKL